jgi:hypothetical protein
MPISSVEKKGLRLTCAELCAKRLAGEAIGAACRVARLFALCLQPFLVVLSVCRLLFPFSF